MTTFREAMDLLCLSAPEAAQLLGVQPQTVRQMRLNPGNPNYRTPPANWREALARIARERVPELQELIAELEASE